MKAYIRIVGQNFLIAPPHVLYDGYTWDGNTAHTGTPINAPGVTVEADDTALDVQKKVIDAAAYLLSLSKHDIVLY